MLLLGLMLLTYAAVHLVTPWDLDWLVAVTRQRLVLHLWPAAVFVFFLVVRTPEELLSKAHAHAQRMPPVGCDHKRVNGLCG